MLKLTRDFYAAPVKRVAKALLGKVLVRRCPQGDRRGIIVETEAYHQDDPACHANCGRTKRNAAMFGIPGTAYVYFIYGIHYCFNVVTGEEGKGEAVLIRAIEPIAGIPLMETARNTRNIKLLCSGPARLCQALNITTDLNGVDLIGNTLYLEQGRPAQEIVTTTRIGISRGRELAYRFYLADNTFISRK